MNDGHYKLYIRSSDYYKNLSIAKSLINEIVADVNNLNMSLSDASGDIIQEMSTDLTLLEKELNSYKENVDSIQNDLNANAMLFDNCYETWKNKIDEVFDSGYFLDNFKYSLNPNATIKSSVFSVNDANFSSLDEINGLIVQGLSSSVVYKYETKLSKVFIGEDNLIHLEYTDYYYGYTKSGVGIEEIFSEKNRDEVKDFSKVSNAGVVDFSQRKFADFVNSNNISFSSNT